MLLFLLPQRESNTLVDLVGAGSPEVAAAILADWTAVDRVRAAYLGHLRTQAGIALSWLAWSVVATNVGENVALYQALLGNVASPWPELARLAHYFAGAVLFGGVVPYVLVACVRRVYTNTSARRSPTRKATQGIRTLDLPITNRLLYQLS